MKSNSGVGIQENEQKYIVRCEHGDLFDISIVAKILNDRTIYGGPSVSIVYLFEYRKEKKVLGRKYASYDLLKVHIP